MKMRQIAPLIHKLSKGYPALAITGPRQSGKTTLAKILFPEKPYVSLENPDIFALSKADPRAFLNKYRDGAIFDEVQKCPELFSYLQEILDSSKKMGRFILTGSQQFGLHSAITQSLSGRVAMAQLFPFAYDEAYSKNPALDSMLQKGLYPPVHDRKLEPSVWYANYMQTYIERDVRQMVQVRDLNVFQRFVKLCAGRSGQLLNLSALSADAGITHNTAKAWISILEAGYLVFLLYPHHRNFNKRVIKTPKLYFYDTGLAAWLLGIHESSQLEAHPLRGPLFETWVVSEMVKMRANFGLLSNLFFWRDREGHELDVLIEKGQDLIPVEIKSGQTINTDFFKGIEHWKKQSPAPRSFLIYGGLETHLRQGTRILGWRDFHAGLKPVL